MVCARQHVSVWFGLFICCLIYLSSCTNRSALVKKRLYVQSKPDPISETITCAQAPIITVWIHGTKIFLDFLLKKVCDNSPNLKHIRDLPCRNRLVMRMKALTDHCSELFPYETVYCFCWSGKLNTHERQRNALGLHEKLLILIDNYENRYHCRPKIRLVCHSHGANLALNLAGINAQKEQKIEIEELIVFACPVQCETKGYVYDGTFKHIYSIYSPLDLVQILAPQWVCRIRNLNDNVAISRNRWLPLSERRFPCAPSVRQAWIKMDGLALVHADFTSGRFLRMIPELTAAIDEAYSECTDLANSESNKQLLLHITTY